MEKVTEKTIEENKFSDEELAENILKMMKELCSAVEGENECLDQSKPEELEEWINKKESLSNEIVAVKDYLKNRDEELGCSKKLKDKIKEAQSELDKSLERNGYLLAEAIDVNNFVLENIKKHVAEISLSGSTYNAGGSKNSNLKTIMNYSIDEKY
jgi:flagellar biosynthesis/type III secretory pathway chaperone